MYSVKIRFKIIYHWQRDFFSRADFGGFICGWPLSGGKLWYYAFQYRNGILAAVCKVGIIFGL